MQSANTQREFMIYDKNRSLRRTTTPFEQDILNSVCEQVKLVFQVPAVLRLVAISLMRSLDPIKWVASASVKVSAEDIEFAEHSLEGGLPQLDIVEGLTVDANVPVRFGDASLGAHVNIEPVRIELKAERFYLLCTLAAEFGKDDKQFRAAFIWLVWALTRQMMNVVRQRAFEHEWDIPAPPRLTSGTHLSRELWWGPPRPSTTMSVYSEDSLPVGNAAFWLEEQLMDGQCWLEPGEDTLPGNELRHSDVDVPTEIKVARIVRIVAKADAPPKGYHCWALHSSVDGQHNLDAFIDARTVQEMETGIIEMRNFIHGTKPGFMPHILRKTTKMDGDVFDGHHAYRLVEIANQFRRRAKPYVAGEIFID
ncbi:hypothetical protein FB451DRAFT_785982 [Mycena latifolia]|nr:hypothetical protein FB451DRAFT_785982 [Mycena latifolia]